MSKIWFISIKYTAIPLKSINIKDTPQYIPSRAPEVLKTITSFMTIFVIIANNIAIDATDINISSVLASSETENVTRRRLY